MWRQIMAVSLGLAAVAACSDGGPNATGDVTVGFGTAATAATTAGGPLLAESYSDSAGNTLVMNEVAVVIRKLHLRGAECIGDTDDDEHHDSIGGPELFGSDSAENEHEDDDEGEGCPQLRAGPFLVDLALDGGVMHDFTVSVDTGTYSGVHFQIHKPRGSRDAAFLAEHPEFDGVSIRATGTYNGVPFTYTTAVTDVQRMRFDPPLVVGLAPATLTVKVDLSRWFRGPGGAIIDPATATDSTMNGRIVRWNIVRSFHGYGRGGHDGDHEGHGGED